MAVPPMQLLRAESGIAMGGEYHTPHIFKEARATQVSEAQFYNNQPTELKLSKVTVDIVTSAMWGVVNEGGTAARIPFPKELNVGGKTGTAQVIAKEKVRGKEHKDHSWFIGFAPMKTDDKPEIGVVCITENGGWGASASAPTVNHIISAYYSKKLNRQLLPDLDMVAVQSRNNNPSPLAMATLPLKDKDVDRKRAPVRQ